MVPQLSHVARLRLIASEMFVNGCAVARRVRAGLPPDSPAALGAAAFEPRVSGAWSAIAPELTEADDLGRAPSPETLRRLAPLVHDLHLYVSSNLVAAWIEYAGLLAMLLAEAPAAGAARPVPRTRPGSPALRVVGGRDAA